MKRIFPVVIFILLIGVGFSSKETLRFNQPTHFPEPSSSFQLTEHSVESAELGRLLFFDPILSEDGTISCASCHSPYNAFAHSDHDLSHGIHDQIGQRNAPALFNLAWQNIFMWDGAANHIETQALAPLTSPIEMGETMEHVLEKLQKSPFYVNQFEQVFGDSVIESRLLLKALASFQFSLVSAHSKYDEVQNGTTHFTPQEFRGQTLFMQQCNSCHTAPLFSNFSLRNNHLPIDTSLNDLGRMAITANPKDSLTFKVPSLRNLSFTAPYMHDGRFNHLNQVLSHYAHLDSELVLDDTFTQAISLSAQDQIDLIAFLLTLNDTSFVFNPAYQFPRELLTKEDHYSSANQ